ncbi:FliI/YscN family ATPase [Salmonella enterica]|nr:FliI/YscN family ATPase [Salmonella enterica]EHO8997886.1 FliI/YscN family ATPase [Salmonella enterica]EKS7036930.1 FliI/YscN family ATPase [Salmonella enterica]ELK1709378.1 FliI/YscN family ATPase [Salmonella enterica]ELX2480118.1 FliI/YscN family ATPase [Salmonella enterica]
MLSDMSPCSLTKINKYIEQADSNIGKFNNKWYVTGTVIKVGKLLISAYLPGCVIGSICKIIPDCIYAEVIAINKNIITLLPLYKDVNIFYGQRILIHSDQQYIYLYDNLVGKVLDGFGYDVLNDNPDINKRAEKRSLNTPPPSFIDKKKISIPLSIGVRAIDALMTCGIGQRIGIFAGSGVGKSSLLEMILKGVTSDIIVLALIGERGREVNEFLLCIPPEIRTKIIFVVATAERSALERMKSAYTATTIAEWYRDKGLNVVLLMDSLTRFARALRDVSLAGGEPLVRGGYTATVFSELPVLLERTGLNNNGSITAIYTVLIEDDSINDPLGDEIRSLLDGHVFLSRKLAGKNFFPAIDILNSSSRVMQNVVSQEHMKAAGLFKDIYSRYEDIELLIRIGEYQRGLDLEMDKIIDNRRLFEQFLRQDSKVVTCFENTKDNLFKLVGMYDQKTY